MFTPDELRWLRAAAVEAILTRRRRGEFVPTGLRSAIARIDDSLKCGISPGGNDRNAVTAQSEPIDVNQAAVMIGCTPRRVRQIAPQLGGRRVGDRWIFQREAIVEHADGRG